MHGNLRPPEPRRSFSALITSHATFEVAEPIKIDVSAAHTLLYAVTLIFDL